MGGFIWGMVLFGSGKSAPKKAKNRPKSAFSRPKKAKNRPCGARGGVLFWGMVLFLPGEVELRGVYLGGVLFGSEKSVPKSAKKRPKSAFSRPKMAKNRPCGARGGVLFG